MPDAPPYPIFLNLTARPVLIVGGGRVGARKTKTLLEAGANITVVSTRYSPAIQEFPNIEKIQAPYSPHHMTLKSWSLVFAATDDPIVNLQVQIDAAAAAIFSCRCDDPDHGSFTTGATHRIGNITLSLSTNGASPLLAKKIRDHAIASIDPILIQLVTLLTHWRTRAKNTIQNPAARSALLHRIAGEEMESCLRIHGPSAAESLFHQWLTQAQTSPSPGGASP